MTFASASALSLALISRELMAMSQVPLMSAARPVPDPPPVTAMNEGFLAMYSSAQACTRFTIVSEHLTWSEPFLAAWACETGHAHRAAAMRSAIIFLVMSRD